MEEKTEKCRVRNKREQMQGIEKGRKREKEK